MKLLVLGLLMSGMALAQKNDLAHRPSAFQTPQGKAVFVDFISADYQISYTKDTKSAKVVATIKFNSPEAGLPVFDSVEAPTTIMLDGTSVSASSVQTPSKETTLRVINQGVSTGSHTLVVTSPLKTLVDFKNEGVKSAFWTSDLDERNFLERYLPANLEYDQVKMTFSLSFEGFTGTQRVYTNGIVKSSKVGNKQLFTISYPEHFNASSIFFHTVPEGTTNEISYSLKSIDGREIPVVIYNGKSIMSSSAALERLKVSANEIFHELEGDYGAWPHSSLIIYNAGSGGMEYCGATITSASALGHEMFHSYFARGVMPANGNAGWLDEALASWRDDGYQSLSTLSGSSKMSSHPYYTRTTDMAAYSFGKRFMSLMDGKLKAQGGLKPFMRHMVENRKFAPLFVEEFIKEMSDFYGVSLEADFRKYTFGTANNFSSSLKAGENVHHHKMSLEELKNIL